MQRDELIRGLSAEYQKGLPDVNLDRVNGYLQESTNTLICIGEKCMESLPKILQAQMYFAQVQLELMKGPKRTEDIEKAEYCKIAENAIKELVNRADKR